MRARSGSAAAAGILLVGIALAAAWLLVAPGIFGSAGAPTESGLAQGGGAASSDQVIGLDQGMRILGAFQASQPRDPFRPLVTETTTTTTVPGETTTTQPGDTTTTQPGDTTTTTTTTVPGFEPGGTTVNLVSIDEVGGVLEAVVTVDGVAYTVREGDTFATDFKVVSLDDDSGVFLYLDNAFTLSVGQEILK